MVRNEWDESRPHFAWLLQSADMVTDVLAARIVDDVCTLGSVFVVTGDVVETNFSEK